MGVASLSFIHVETYATTVVVDTIDLDSDALSRLAQVLHTVPLQAVASRTQRRIRLDHVEVFHLHRNDGELITKPLDKHAKSFEQPIGSLFDPESNKLNRARSRGRRAFLCPTGPRSKGPSGTGRCSSVSIRAGGRQRRDCDSSITSYMEDANCGWKRGNRKNRDWSVSQSTDSKFAAGNTVLKEEKAQGHRDPEQETLRELKEAQGTGQTEAQNIIGKNLRE